MERTLKTYNELERDLKPLCVKWIHKGNTLNMKAVIDNRTYYWFINSSMFKYLGRKINFENIYRNLNYTHKAYNCLWHESWFKMNTYFPYMEFLSEDDVMI